MDKDDGNAVFSAMMHVIDLQQSYIKQLETPEGNFRRIPEAFNHLQQSLDKFSLHTRSKRRMLSHLENSSYPCTNLNQELALGECDQISVETYNSQ